VHLYGKQTTKPFRKMGHVTIFGDTLDIVKAKGRQVSETLRVIA